MDQKLLKDLFLYISIQSRENTIQPIPSANKILCFKKRFPIRVLPVSGKRFYVDSEYGNDPASGDFEFPRKSFQRVKSPLENSEIPSYSSIVFRRARVYPIRDSLEIHNISGPINLTSFGEGNLPILKYTGEDI